MKRITKSEYRSSLTDAFRRIADLELHAEDPTRARMRQDAWRAAQAIPSSCRRHRRPCGCIRIQLDRELRRQVLRLVALERLLPLNVALVRRGYPELSEREVHARAVAWVRKSVPEWRSEEQIASIASLLEFHVSVHDWAEREGVELPRWLQVF